MHLHSRSIYGASQSADCRLTQRGDRLYLHIFAWPLKYIHLSLPAEQIEYAQLLNDRSEVRLVKEGDENGMMQRDAATTFELLIERPDVLVPVIELLLLIDAFPMERVKVQFSA